MLEGNAETSTIWVGIKRFGNYTQIITLDNNTITLSNSIGKSLFLSYKDYKQITFADGSVFGVKVED